MKLIQERFKGMDPQKKIRLRYIWEKFSNIVLALIFFRFAVIFAFDIVETHRISSCIFLLYESIIIFLFLIRPIPKEISTSVYNWVIAIVGTASPLLFRPTVEVNDTMLLWMIQMFGVLVSFSGVLFLNKSFGIVPADRGIKTNGMYKYIRHPLYSGYIFTYGAFICQNTSNFNVFVLFLLFALTFLRMFAEEQFLSSANEEYKEYLKKVKWRVIPYVF